MSTRADCHIYEKESGWYYDIQRWPYGEHPEYDTEGPFDSLDEAQRHLGDNYANPGGYSVTPLKQGR